MIKRSRQVRCRAASVSDSVTLTRAADRAVADPATAPASLGGIREGAAAVRAALDAIYAGDESAALAALKFRDSRPSLNGSCLSGGWPLIIGRMPTPCRPTGTVWPRIVLPRGWPLPCGGSRTQALKRAIARSSAALRVLEKDLLGDTVIWCLESLQKSLGADRWREAVFAMRRWKRIFRWCPA